jgi:hypothetical protein
LDAGVVMEDKKSTRYFSGIQEKKIAKSLGGRRQPNSGAMTFRKGDIDCSEFLIEAKTSTTDKKVYSVKKEELEKLNRERFRMGKQYAALCFDFGPSSESEDRYYIITEKTFKECMELLKTEADSE